MILKSSNLASLRQPLRVVSSFIVLALVTISLSLSNSAPAQAALVSQFQAQSPVSVYIPANQPVPAQGSTVTLTFERSDFTGPNAEQQYEDALDTAPTATVRNVVADLGYRVYEDVNTIANAGDLGYLVTLDFGAAPAFNYAYVGYFSFSTAATTIDATGVTGVYQFNSGGVDYLWVPTSVDTSAVTGIVDAWSYPTLTSITATSSHTLVCSEVVNFFSTENQDDCAALPSLAGTRLDVSSAPATVVSPDSFYGLAGLDSTIVGGLVQSSIVSLPSQNTGSTAPAKYVGPEFSGLSAKEIMVGISTRLEGKNLDEISSIEIGGKAATFTLDGDKALDLTLPAGLAPGLYDLVIQSGAGKLTHINAIQVREPRRAFSITTRSEGRISEEQYQEHAIISSMQISELNKARCIVNGSNLAQAKEQAERLCALVAAANPNIETTVIEPRSTVKNNSVFARVTYGWN